MGDYTNYIKNEKDKSSPDIRELAWNHWLGLLFPVEHKQFHKIATLDKGTLQLGWIKAKNKTTSYLCQNKI